MESILTWFVRIFLGVLLKRAEAYAEELRAQHEIAAARGETNAENLQKYEGAKTRAEEINTAVDLLNGTR
jgi:hypothetical protein